MITIRNDASGNEDEKNVINLTKELTKLWSVYEPYITYKGQDIHFPTFEYWNLLFSATLVIDVAVGTSVLNRHWPGYHDKA